MSNDQVVTLQAKTADLPAAPSTPHTPTFIRLYGRGARSSRMELQRHVRLLVACRRAEADRDAPRA